MKPDAAVSTGWQRFDVDPMALRWVSRPGDTSGSETEIAPSLSDFYELAVLNLKYQPRHALCSTENINAYPLEDMHGNGEFRVEVVVLPGNAPSSTVVVSYRQRQGMFIDVHRSVVPPLEETTGIGIVEMTERMVRHSRSLGTNTTESPELGSSDDNTGSEKSEHLDEPPLADA
jgi:hypothetical protein